MSILLYRNLTVAYLWFVGVAGGKGNDGVSKRGFSEYDGSHVCRSSVCGYVQEIQGVVFFSFRREQ